jgi:hypothetical protein
MEDRKARMKAHGAVAARASISLPQDLIATPEDLAKETKDSLAFVVGDAAEQYVVGQRNPFGGVNGGDHADGQ